MSCHTGDRSTLKVRSQLDWVCMPNCSSSSSSSAICQQSPSDHNVQSRHFYTLRPTVTLRHAAFKVITPTSVPNVVEKVPLFVEPTSYRRSLLFAFPCTTPHTAPDTAHRVRHRCTRHAAVDAPTHEFEATARQSPPTRRLTVAFPSMVTVTPCVRRAWRCGPRSSSRVPPHDRDTASRRGCHSDTSQRGPSPMFRRPALSSIRRGSQDPCQTTSVICRCIN